MRLKESLQLNSGLTRITEGGSKAEGEVANGEYWSGGLSDG